MPGIFTDGPHVNRSKKCFEDEVDTGFSFPWTSGFAEYFEKMHGYSPVEHLHHLVSCSDEGFKFRHDFRIAVNERFLESYTIRISSWCREHDVLFTGHFPHENELSGMISSGGAVMSHYEYLDIPGIDNPSQNSPGIMSIKQASSVANQLGKKRVIGKIFGSSGYSISFEDMKRIVNFQCALGITFLSPRHVQYSMTGVCKEDDPTTFSYHQPYWERFRVINDYMARCSWAVSQGRSTASVLVISPVNSAYGAYDFNSEDGGKVLNSIELSYTKVMEELLAEHIAFDIGDERILARHGSVSEDILRVGNREYACIILPYSLTWRSSTLDLLESFAGQVIIMGDVSKRVDGTISDRVSVLLDKGNVTSIPDDPPKAAGIIVEKIGIDVSIKGVEGSDARSVLVNHRVEAGAHVIFLANTDSEKAAEIYLTVNALGGVLPEGHTDTIPKLWKTVLS